MKKLTIFLVALTCCIVSYAQRSVQEFAVSERMYEQFSKTEIEQMRQNDFAQLFKLNFKMNNYAMVSAKLSDENYKIMGPVQQYAKAGVVTNEEQIIRDGYLNPFLYDFPQDDFRVNVFTFSKEGYYVLVIPKIWYDERVKAQLNEYGF